MIMGGWAQKNDEVDPPRHQPRLRRHVDRQQLFIMLRALSYERINDFECIEKQIIGAT